MSGTTTVESSAVGLLIDAAAAVRSSAVDLLVDEAAAVESSAVNLMVDTAATVKSAGAQQVTSKSWYMPVGRSEAEGMLRSFQGLHEEALEGLLASQELARRSQDWMTEYEALEAMDDYYPIVTEDNRGTTTLVSTNGAGSDDFYPSCN